MRVLLIEDNDVHANLITELLRPDMDVVHVESVSALLGSNFDMALLDLNIGETSGADTVDAFKRLWPNLPFVVLSSAVTDDVRDECNKRGVFAVLDKGVVSRETLLVAMTESTNAAVKAAAAVLADLDRICSKLLELK